MTDGGPFEAAAGYQRIAAATACLLDTAGGLDDAAMRADSLLPGWSRGHVLTHVARNADGGRRLLSWARTGVETPEYASMASRAADIEAGAGRSPAELLADVRESAERFAVEYARMPVEAWSREVHWTQGRWTRAVRIADSRLTELRLHCVDLDAGYLPGQWPADFTEDLLHRIAAALAVRSGAPAMRLHATDTGARYAIGAVAGAPLVEGEQSELLAWLTGRSDGAGLLLSGAAELPVPIGLG